MKISVAMAYYNGGTYIEEQMDSILSQLGNQDEVIVSVDGASDGSEPILLNMEKKDDIWKPDKVKKVNAAFDNLEVKAILHDAEITDENGKATGAERLFALRKSKPGILKNLIKNSYVGCCMAFRKELIPVICPIPKEMYMHDYWIGTAADYMGQVCFLKDKLIGYRRHSSNVTQMTHGSIDFMVKKRIDIIRCLGLLKKRVREIG